jgi:hypothetical protein
MKRILILSLISSPIFAMQQPKNTPQAPKTTGFVATSSLLGTGYALSSAIIPPTPASFLAREAVRVGAFVAMSEGYKYMQKNQPKD